MQKDVLLQIPPNPELQKVSDRYAGLKVLGIAPDQGACGYYRVINPIKMLKMHGATAEWRPAKGLQDILGYDIILFPRQYQKTILEIERFVQWEGKTCIYEIDDDLDHLLPSSPAYSSFHTGTPATTGVKKFISHCHGLTCTTPEIARWYYQFNQNVTVIENYIDFSLRDWNVDVEWVNGYPVFNPKPFKKIPGLEDKIVIGWSGGTTHGEDLGTTGIGDTLRRILNEREDVVFAFYGEYKLLLQIIEAFNLPKDKVYHIPPQQFQNHPSLLHGIDIGLAPIVPCQFNLAKCVVGDTLMYTPQGIIPIKDLHVGREEDSYYPLNVPVFTQNGVKTSSHFYYAGVQDTIKITTKRGFTTEVSLTHRLKNGLNEWQKATDFKIGDSIKLSEYNIPEHIPYVEVPYTWTCTRKDSKISDPSLASSAPKVSIDEIWGELIGFILSDGHVTPTGLISICVSGNDPDVKDRITHLFRAVGLEPTIKQPDSRHMFYVTVNSRPLSEFLYSIGLVQNKKKAKDTLSVPNVILRSRKSVIVAFLRGMFEGDGTVNKNTGCSIASCSHKLVRDVHEILLGFGIVGKLDKNIAKCQSGSFEYSRLYLSRANTDIFAKEIGFVGKRKSARLASIIAKPHSNAYKPIVFGDEIVEITHGRQELFDITVPDGEHWLGGGFVQHNSPLKPIEYLASGANVVASNVGPYARFERKFPGSITTVGDGKWSMSSWYTAIMDLVNDPVKRQKRQIEGRNLILEHYSLEKNFVRWPAAWSSIVKSCDKGIIGPPDKKLEGGYVSYGLVGRNDPCVCGSGIKYKNCCKTAFG